MPPPEIVSVPKKFPSGSAEESTVTVIVLVPLAPTGIGEPEAESQLPPDIVLGVIEYERLPEVRLVNVTVWLGGEMPRFAPMMSIPGFNENEGLCARAVDPRATKVKRPASDLKIPSTKEPLGKSLRQ